MTPSQPEERVRAILAALDALPEGALDQLAPSLPGPAGAVLRAVAAARQAPDREAALRKVVETHLSDLEAVARLFGGAGLPAAGGASRASRSASATPADPGVSVGALLGGAFKGQMARVEADLARADTLARSLANAQAELSGALDPLVERVKDDDALVAAANVATAELRDPAIGLLIRDLVADADALRTSIAALTSAAAANINPADVQAMEGRAGRLEARAREATSLGQSLPARIAGPLADLAALARTRGHAAAAELAQVDARMDEMVNGATAASARVKWRRSLDLALAAKRVDLAWTAGKRVQVEALDSGEKKLAAIVAHRVADLAQEVGAADVAVTARMEEALLLVRLPGLEEQGRGMTEKVLVSAEEAPPPVRARVLLMAGQAFEALGDEARSRTLYRRLMRLKDEAPPAELGRAALHLGRLELRGGQPSQGRKNVRLAYDIAVARADAGLYAEVVPTLLASLVEAGRDEDALALVRSARDRYTRLGYADAFRADLEQRWGAARVTAWWG